MLKRISVIETIKTFEIKKFEKTLLPRELEIIIEENDRAVNIIRDLRQIIKKVCDLGFQAEAKVCETEWLKTTMEIRPQVCYNRVIIEIRIPKEGELNKFKKLLEDKPVEEVLETLEQLALEEKEKSISFLEKLEKMGLVIHVETRETDC